jgi:hypothetical protein
MDDCAELGDQIAGLSAKLNVATHRLLTCIRRFDELDGWYEQGAQSCAHWLTWRVGLDRGAAREKVRVARALGALPKIDEAFAAGQLSYSKVRALTRVATTANEERMLEVALAATGAQLERICAGFRQATEMEVEASRDRYVRGRALGNGLVKLEIVVSPDEADLILKAIEHARERLSPPKEASSRPSRTGTTTKAALPRPSSADAIVCMAAAQLAGGASAAAPAPDRCQVVVHVDRELTDSDSTLRASLEDGTHVSAETLRRVACDGGVVTAAVDQEGAVLDVGRRTRSIPTAIRRALWIRDQGCRFPGCTNDRFLHGHHIEHWLHGGRTSLDNLVMLCSFHHRQIHEGGFSIRLAEDGQVQVQAPGKPRLWATASAFDDAGGVQWNDWWNQRPADMAHVATPSWSGEALDLEWAVHTLLG